MIQPPNKRLAVEPLNDPDMIGSLYVPDQAKERVDQGIVKYIGNDCKYVSIGDHVLFSGHAGTLVYIEGEGRLIIIPERFITAIIYDNPVGVLGLYMKDKDGNYFMATYESAMQYMAASLETASLIKTSKKWGSKSHGSKYYEHEVGDEEEKENE